MFVLCVVSKDKQEKCRTNKTKKRVMMKYRVQQNILIRVTAGDYIFRTSSDRPWGPPSMF
jgi:hypothetical protein